LDTLQEKQAHAGPESAVKYSYPKGISDVFSFNKKGWLKNPQHATTELSQLETCKLRDTE